MIVTVVVVVVVLKVPRNRKNRGEDQKNEVKRKIRSQEDENRDKVKDRKRMKEVMTLPAVVLVPTIGKIHQTMTEIQVRFLRVVPSAQKNSKIFRTIKFCRTF